MDIFLIFFNMKVYCMFSLESPHRVFEPLKFYLFSLKCQKLIAPSIRAPRPVFKYSFNLSRKEKPPKLTQLSPRSYPRHLVGKKDSTKRRHQRHHKREPGEQLFPIQVVTGYYNN